MKILIVSDEESKFIWEHFDKTVFNDVQLVISAGDLKSDYLAFLATMIPKPLFFIPGNHDKHFVKTPPEGCISLDEDVIIYSGVRIAGLGGCRSNNPNAVYEYCEKKMQQRVVKLEKKIKKQGGLDIFVSHTPTLGYGDGKDDFHKGFECFKKLLDNAQPKLHIFGHQHKRYTYSEIEPEYYNKTKLYNACGYKIIEYTPS